jgi:hypothetical protein
MIGRYSQVARLNSPSVALFGLSIPSGLHGDLIAASQIVPTWASSSMTPLRVRRGWFGSVP